MVKIPYPRNAKQHYQSFIKRKNRKSVKQLKVITDQPKTFESQMLLILKQLLQIIQKLRINYPKL